MMPVKTEVTIPQTDFNEVVIKNISRLVCSYYKYIKGMSLIDAVKKGIEVLTEAAVVTHSKANDKLILYVLNPSPLIEAGGLLEYVRQNIRQLHALEVCVALFILENSYLQSEEKMPNDYRLTVPFLKGILQYADQWMIDKQLLVEGVYTPDPSKVKITEIDWGTGHDPDEYATEIISDGEMRLKNAVKQTATAGSFTPMEWYDEHIQEN